MYLKWKNTRKGSIFLDKGGLKDFVERNLYQGVFCQDIALLGEKKQLFITLMRDESERVYLDRVALSEDLTKVLKGLGLDVVVSWRESREDDSLENTNFAYTPYFWALLVSIFTALVNLGLKKSFLCLFLGAVTYGVVSFFQSQQGRKIIENITEIIKEAID